MALVVGAEPVWWRTAVVYEIYVRSFADSNGDGEGDLAGIRSRLPYLADLGIDAIWLTPFYPSPLADGGYDVADYCNVDHRFGSLDDFDALVSDAHGYGLRVVVDIVPNHTSIEHPWFVAALTDGPGSAAEDRYVIRTGRGSLGELPPNNWSSEFGGPAWSMMPGRPSGAARWYLHLFAAEQPDLNWADEQVRRDFDAILDFWLDRGVDGFRIDVAHGLVKAADLPDNAVQSASIDSPRYQPIGHQWHQPGVHEIYRRWRAVVDGRGAGAQTTLIGEVWASDTDQLVGYLRPAGLRQVFTFDLLECGWVAEEFRTVITDAIRGADKVEAVPTWVLSNHDRVRQVTRYGGGAVGEARARAAALLMLSLPGSAYLYQGEELGLPEATVADHAKRDPMFVRSMGASQGRDGCRVPLPWTVDGPAFGFSDNTRAWLPMPAKWGALSVAAQLAERSSTLQLYRQAIALRRVRRQLAAEPLVWRASGDYVLALQVGTLLCIVNFGKQPSRVPEGATLLLSSAAATDGESAPEKTMVGPDSAAWFELA